MVNIKKIDDIDWAVINRPETEEELKAFSDMLKKKRDRKERLELKKNKTKIAEKVFSKVS